MDIFAHGLWSGVSYAALKRNSKRPLSVRLAVIWGVLPDLFAFTLPFVVLIWQLVTRQLSFADFRPHTEVEPVNHDFPLSGLTDSLYNLSHSLIVFAVVFIIVALIKRKAVWEMGAWLIHILIDIPTHSYDFFPTPFLWPLSDFRVNGFAWGSPLFMLVNYSLILLSVYVLWRTKAGRPRRLL